MEGVPLSCTWVRPCLTSGDGKINRFGRDEEEKANSLRLIGGNKSEIQYKTGYGFVEWLRAAVVVNWGRIEVVMRFNEARQSKQESGSQGDALNIGHWTPQNAPQREPHVKSQDPCHGTRMALKKGAWML